MHLFICKHLKIRTYILIFAFLSPFFLATTRSSQKNFSVRKFFSSMLYKFFTFFHIVKTDMAWWTSNPLQQVFTRLPKSELSIFVNCNRIGIDHKPLRFWFSIAKICIWSWYENSFCKNTCQMEDSQLAGDLWKALPFGIIIRTVSSGNI